MKHVDESYEFMIETEEGSIKMQNCIFWKMILNWFVNNFCGGTNQ